MKKILILIPFVFYTALLAGQKPVDFILKGKALTEAGKTDEAVNTLSEGLRLNQDAGLYLQRAEAWLTRGDYSQAISDLNSANKLSPGIGEYGLARIYGLKGDASTATYHLEENMRSSFRKREKDVMLDPAFSTIENKPEWRTFIKKEWYSDLETGLSEIEYYISTGNTGEARSVLSELSKNYPDNDGNIYANALINFADKRYTETIKAISSLLTDDPGEEKYLRLLAGAQAASGNQAGASSTYTKLLDLGIPDAELLILRSECYRKTGETARALDDASKYLDLYPDSKKALSFAGKIEAASGDNIKALEYFSKNLELHPNDAECYIDRANSYFVSKSWNWAIKDYSMSLDLRPDDPEVWLNKGIAQLNSGNTADACHDFRKSFSLGNKKATEMISRHCISQGR